MQLNNLKPNPKAKKKRVGRGGTKGTTATRGTKGQKSRSGAGKGPSFEGTKTPLFRRTPKLRGFKSMYAKKEIVKIADIESNFSDGETVTPRVLVYKGLIKTVKNGVKVLNVGEITKKVIVEDCLTSKAAEEKIKKAGGEVKKVIVEE